MAEYPVFQGSFDPDDWPGLFSVDHAKEIPRPPMPPMTHMNWMTVILYRWPNIDISSIPPGWRDITIQFILEMNACKSDYKPVYLGHYNHIFHAVWRDASETRSKRNEIYQKAKDASQRTCELCGLPGKKNEQGLMVLCSFHP